MNWWMNVMGWDHVIDDDDKYIDNNTIMISYTIAIDK